MCGKYSAGGAQKCGLNLCKTFHLLRVLSLTANEAAPFTGGVELQRITVSIPILFTRQRRVKLALAAAK